LSSKDKDLILGEPITEVHDYNKKKDILSVRTLGEALEATAQHVADALQTAEDEEQHEQTDDES
jgi:hypothetical protein